VTKAGLNRVGAFDSRTRQFGYHGTRIPLDPKFPANPGTISGHPERDGNACLAVRGGRRLAFRGRGRVPIRAGLRAAFAGRARPINPLTDAASTRGAITVNFA
jgi:hypothetical protein